MDWDKLRIFYAVAEAGSFTHAGGTLNLSQSAISRQISALEESVGVKLFHRHARGLLLTEQGELLHKTSRDIFAQLTALESKLWDTHKLPEGPLRITVASFVGTTWLAPKIKKFIEQHPDIQLTILQDNRIYDLGMREADAAIRLYKPEQPDLIRRSLTKINFHICASKSYLKKHGTPETLKDLKNHRLIGFPDNVMPPFEDPNWLFRVAGIDPNQNKNVVFISSLYAIHNVVVSGGGIAALPDYMIQSNKDLEIILPRQKGPQVEMYFVYPEERRNSKRIGTFRDFLLKELKQTEF